jgi:hypothetical protein
VWRPRAFVSRVLPVEADRAGARLQWLGERESLVFANTFTLAFSLAACRTASRALPTRSTCWRTPVRAGLNGRWPGGYERLSHPVDTLLTAEFHDLVRVEFSV